MKKNFVFSIAVIAAFISLANLDGALPGNTNAPGELTCGRAPCHNVGVNIGDAEISILFGSPEPSYRVDSLYQVKVVIKDPLTMRNGFQIHAIDENLSNVGTWELVDPLKTKIISGFSDPTKKYVTHRSAGNLQDEWIVNWKAPSSDLGRVTFYTSVLSANDNGRKTGDEVYSTSLDVEYDMSTSISGEEESPINIYPTITTHGVWLEIPHSHSKHTSRLYDQNGKLVLLKDVADGGRHYLDLESMRAGVFILKVDNGQRELVSTKVMKL